MTGRNPGVIQEERHSEPSEKKPASGTEDAEETQDQGEGEYDNELP